MKDARITAALETFSGLPLTIRMRAAADVLDEVCAKGGLYRATPKVSGDLRDVAAKWDLRDADTLAKEQAVTELAERLARFIINSDLTKDTR